MTAIAPFGSSTHTGRVRQHNEDCIGVHPELGLYVVADGMGGRSGGEVASRRAVETIGRVISSGASLNEAIVRADLAISAAVSTGEGHAGMGRIPLYFAQMVCMDWCRMW